jgi:catechol 1,2-dioxygenase
MKTLKQKFIGRWKLKYAIIRYDNSVIFPFGKNLKSILFYDEDYMSVQIMMNKNQQINEQSNNLNLKDLAWALKNIGYLAYFAKYEIDDNKKIIKHFVKGSIVQSIVGKTEIRNYKFENNYNDLVLSAGPMELRWIKDK